MEMNRAILMLLVFGLIVLVGCTSLNQVAKESIDQEDVGEAKKAKPKQLYKEIRTLPDGTKYIIHPDKLIPGIPGAPKDAIPSLDNPKFQPVEEADRWLNDDDLVLGLDYKGSVRAYPHRILNWHEIVNDNVNGENVLITYCPLCRTGIAFKPVVNGQEVQFGTSGRLYNSELVMYDRLTESYWPQTLGKAVVGPATGQVLDKIPLDTAMWGDWKKVHPESEVLRKQTGFIRDYDRNPYASIQNSNTIGFDLSDFDDFRLKTKEIIYGVEFDGVAKAYAEDAIKRDKAINDEVNGVPIIVFWYEDLNTARIFERALDGETLDFRLENSKIVDNKGNEWSVDEMTEKLAIVDTFGHFWFAWASFFPETELYQ